MLAFRGVSEKIASSRRHKGLLACFVQATDHSGLRLERAVMRQDLFINALVISERVVTN